MCEGHYLQAVVAVVRGDLVEFIIFLV